MIDGERRKYKRVKKEIDVRIILESDTINLDSVKKVRSKDIGAGGILLQYNNALDLEALVDVSFLKPNSFDFFQGRARVVRVEINPDNETYEVGVEFLDLTDSDMERLNYYLTLS